MYKISEKFQNCLENDFSFVTKSKIVVEGKEYLSNIIKTTPKIVHKNEKMIGGFPTKTCSFEMYNFDGINFIGKEVAVYRGLLVDGEIEYIPQGIFIPREENVTNNISQRTISFNNIQDKTQFFDAQYQSSLDWSTKHTGLEIIQEICNNLNIELESADFNWATYEFQQPNFVETTTYREVVSRLAEIGGNIAFINRLGQLSIKGQTDTEHVIKRKRYVDLKKEDLFGSINTVVLGKDGKNDNIVFPESIEEERKEWKIYDNPFVDLYRQDMIEEVSKYIIGKSIIPFTMNDFVDGFYLDLNDTISIIDKNGEIFTGVILNYQNNSKIKSSVGADVQTNSKTNYNLAGSNKKSLNQIKLDVDHINQRIESVAESVSENSSKITKAEQDIEGFRQIVDGVYSFTREESGKNSLVLEEAQEGYLMELHITGDVEVLYPEDDLYPDDDLYPLDTYLIIESSKGEKEYFHLPNDNEYLCLYTLDDVKDELVLETIYDEENEKYIRTLKIIRRITLDSEGNKTKLTNPVIEDYGELDLPLFKGTNKIYMESFDNLSYSAKYAIINEITDEYATHAELKTSITQSETSIKGEVYGKFDGLEKEIKGSIELKLNTKDLCSELNTSVDKVRFETNRFSWQSDYSSMTEDGKITATSGNIGGFELQKDSFSATISYTFPTITDADNEKIRQYLLGNTQLTSQEKEKYDLNGDGVINSVDLLMSRQLTLGQLKNPFTGSFSLNTNDAKNTIMLSSNGTFDTKISMLAGVASKFGNFGNLRCDSFESPQANATNITYETITQSSDERIKKDIDDLKPIYIDFVKKLKPKIFTYKKSNKRSIGFIAQDVLKNIELLNIENTFVEKDELLEVYSLNYVEMIPAMVLTIQNLEERLNEIENGKDN